MRYFSLVGGFIIALGLTSACSLAYDLSADQCELDTDCEALGGEFRGRVCKAGVCEPRLGGTGGGGGGGGAGLGGCNSTAECYEDPENFGPHACIERECVALTTTSCPVVYPSEPATQERLLKDSTGEPIILGGFVPLTVTLETRYSINYDLAISEFNEETLGGVTGTDLKKHPLIMVACEDPEGSREQIEASMDHLVDKLKVPGIVATMLVDDLSYAFEYKRMVEHPPFIMSALEGDPALTAIPDGGLMWHSLPGGEAVALVYKPLLTRVLDSLGLEEPARVALITDPDISLLTKMTETILDEREGTGIEFNGNTALANGDETFRLFNARYSQPAGELASVVAELHEFKPHVIISNTTTAFFSQIYDPLEKDWLSKTENAPRPFYFMSPYHYNTAQFLGKIASLQSRFAGANTPIGDPLLVRAYFTRLDTAYPTVQDKVGFENFYDAPYYVMYATAKALFESNTIYGEDIARAMRSITEIGAREREVGTGDIPETLQDLRDGSIQLNGLLGAPNWNLSTGSRTTPGSVWCGGGTKQITDVYKYNAQTAELELGVDPNGEPYAETPCAAKF